MAHERIVVLLQDTAPFSLDRGEIVRLTGEGMAGSRISAEIEGPARVVAENVITRLVEGKHVLGPGDREFEIEPTGKGMVKVTLSSSPPSGGQPSVTEYRFEAK